EIVFLIATMLSEDNESTNSKTINDLPMEILHKIFVHLELRDRLNARLCCSTVEKAVASADLKCVGMDLNYDSRNSACKILLDRCEVFTCKTRFTSQRNSRLFSKLHVQLITIREVRLIDVPAVNVILNACTFDILAVHLSPNQWLSSRIHELIARAEKGVDIFTNRFVATSSQFRSLSRPVTFHFDKEWKPENDDLFLEILLRGHSFPRLDIKLQSEHTLIEAIEIISEAVIPQKMYISYMKNGHLKTLLRLTNAKETGNSAFEYGTEYSYLRSLIFQRTQGSGDLLVTSSAFDEHRELYDDCCENLNRMSLFNNLDERSLGVSGKSILR
ncbi:hypothetical protein PENTCL1PPCAC_3491, partial [Pristionchus entomophagus]